MRKIVEKELGLRIPVIVYIAPAGARGASCRSVGLPGGRRAGDGARNRTSARRPRSNRAARTSVAISRRKEINDSAASLRGLGADPRTQRGLGGCALFGGLKSHRHRGAEDERDRPDRAEPSLAAQSNQWPSDACGEPQLHAAHGGRHDHRFEPGILHSLPLGADRPDDHQLCSSWPESPGVGFEIFHPGAVLPGALGGVALLIALFGFSVLPISWIPVRARAAWHRLLAADVHVQSHGALTVSGLIALGIGLPRSFNNAPAPYHTSVPARRRVHGRDRRLLGLCDHEGDR